MGVDMIDSLYMSIVCMAYKHNMLQIRVFGWRSGSGADVNHIQTNSQKRSLNPKYAPKSFPTQSLLGKHTTLP